ncbi:MAG: hypothetical protein ACFFCS_00385 [Candidatus Hodarchaeota archaeon]
MIRQLLVIASGGMLVYSRQYGTKQVDQDLISGFLMALSNFSVEVKGGAIESLVMQDVRFIYSVGDYEYLFVFCADKDDMQEEVQERIDRVKSEFYSMFGDQLQNWSGNVTIFKPFDEIVDDLVMLPLKIVIVGEPEVGKTTILKFFPGESILSFDDADTPIEKKSVEVEGIQNVKQIDFFKYTLESLVEEIRFHLDILKSADLVLLVVSSGASNVGRTKKHVKKIENFTRKGRLVCLANMQDMKDVALEPSFIEKAFGIKTYGFTARAPDSKMNFFQLIGQMLANVFTELPEEASDETES